MSPRKEVSRCIRTQLPGFGDDSDTAEIQTIGVPAGEQSGISGEETVSMQPTGFVEQVELAIRQMNQSPAQRASQVSAALAMTIVPEFVDAARVVE